MLVSLTAPTGQALVEPDPWTGVWGSLAAFYLTAAFGSAGAWIVVAAVVLALAFGLTVVTGAYAFGHISGAHFNPAVSFGLWAGGRFPVKDLLPYIAAQVAGARHHVGRDADEGAGYADEAQEKN